MVEVELGMNVKLLLEYRCRYPLEYNYILLIVYVLKLKIKNLKTKY